MSNDHWHVLDHAECLALLDHRDLGRIAFRYDGKLNVLPINYVRLDEFVIFRTGEGGKLDAALSGQDVAFEIDGVESPDRTGWNVLVRGRAEFVDDEDELAALRSLHVVPWAPGAKPHYIRISTADTTGRRISAEESPSQWWG